MSGKNPGQEKKEPTYETVIESNEESVVKVTWKDEEGNVIVHGEKKVRGGQAQAQHVANAFANDLKRNFANRFPAPIIPPGLEDELEGDE